MKKNPLKNILTGFAVLLCVATATNVSISNATSAKAETSDFPCSFTAAPVDKEYMCYGSSEVIFYTADEAAAAGVPAGYNGNVLKVVPLASATSCGVLLDFSATQIPVSLVDSLEFRFYVETNASNTGSRPQLRIAQPFEVNNAWVYQPGSTPSKTGVWTTETVQNENNKFQKLADEKGYLYKFELSVRSNVRIPFYIDNIAVNTIENDGVAPVITYKGGESVHVSMGAELGINATAYDAQEKCSVPVEYVWEEGVALDEKGVPAQIGEYTLTLRAKDYFGNVSEKTVLVTVSEPDVQAPVIHLDFTEMRVPVGTTPILNVKVTDDRTVANVTKTWSDGALDEYGRLTEGEHTYTVIAKDTSNNLSQKVITVYVTAGEPDYENVVDEEELTKFSVTFDGIDSGKIYRYGDKIDEPADPEKATDEFVYTFLGWYNGEEKWDFENYVIASDLELVSKWKKTPVETSTPESSVDSSIEDDSSQNSSVEEDNSIESSIEDESSVDSSVEEDSSIDSSIEDDSSQDSSVEEDNSQDSSIEEDSSQDSSVKTESSILDSSDAESDGEAQTGKKKGCSSIMSVMPALLVMLCAGIVTMRKGKKE